MFFGILKMGDKKTQEQNTKQIIELEAWWYQFRATVQVLIK